MYKIYIYNANCMNENKTHINNQHIYASRTLKPIHIILFYHLNHDFSQSSIKPYYGKTKTASKASTIINRTGRGGGRRGTLAQFRIKRCLYSIFLFSRCDLGTVKDLGKKGINKRTQRQLSPEIFFSSLNTSKRLFCGQYITTDRFSVVSSR